MLKDCLNDKKFIENKYHDTNKPFDSFNRMAYHGCECDSSTGLNDYEMELELKKLTDEVKGLPHSIQKARAFEFVLDNARIDVLEYDYFFCLYNWNRPLSKFTVYAWNSQVMNEKQLSDVTQKYISDNKNNGNIECWMDYDHSVPDWQALYKLGFIGILKRAQKYKKDRESKNSLSKEQKAYFDAIEIEYSAILRFIERIYNLAKNKKFEKAKLIAESMNNLLTSSPKTTFDVLQLIYLYFMISESVDSYQVRSLGSGLDYDLYPYFKNDIEDGKFSKEEIAEFIGYFLMQFSAIGNYWGQPFYMGGTKLDGKTTKVNDISYLILDVYDKLGIYNPKIQIKYNIETTPEKFILTILNMIREGHSSFTIVCERNVYKAFEKRGIVREEYYDFDVKGCYEYAVKAKEISTGPLYTNLLQSVNNVIEEDLCIDTYEKFEEEYYNKLNKLFSEGINAVNEIEKHLEFVNPAPMLSGTIINSLEKAVDAYYKGSIYNSTVLIINGFASAVDALMGVKYLVYDTKSVTLAKLKAILANNWKGYEELRTQVLNCAPKYGNGDKQADLCSMRLAEFVASWQKNKNARDGYYKIEIHSARMYIILGKRTNATSDGRYAGDETSKNASPTAGMDTNGVTALILSVLKTKPYQFTEGHCLDIMLHPSAVQGEEGLKAFKGLLDVYENGGGMSLNVNILNSEILKKAQLEPEKYQNLQVRVCGWNVLFNNMPKEEQDEYIKRAENLK